MGGRGASDWGGGGGGVSITVAETRDLVSERERKQVEVDQVLTTARNIMDDYGYIIEGLDVSKLKGRGAKSVIAYFSPSDGTLGVNEYFFDAEKLEGAYADSIKSGFHPKKPKRISALEAVTAHEMGHALNQAVADKLGGNIDSIADRIVAEAYGTNQKEKIKRRNAKISGYAGQDNAEAIAEAFADVYCNGKKAKADSKRIKETLDRYMRQ